jgi:hypothetical protein
METEGNGKTGKPTKTLSFVIFGLFGIFEYSECSAPQIEAKQADGYDAGPESFLQAHLGRDAGLLQRFELVDCPAGISIKRLLGYRKHRKTYEDHNFRNFRLVRKMWFLGS